MTGIPACEVCWHFQRQVAATWCVCYRNESGQWATYAVCDAHATGMDRLPWAAAEEMFR